MRYAAGLARGSAPGSIALIGAPSDQSGGATITLALDGLGVEVTAEPALGVELIADDNRLELASVAALHAPSGLSVTPVVPQGPLGVMLAACRQILAGRDDLADAGFRLELTASEIPAGVGLGDTSATVLATLEALSGLFGAGLAHEQLAPLALACMTEQLGLPASLRDPVAQSEGGVTFMDFDADGGGRYEPLDSTLLPPLFIAWPTAPEAPHPPSVEKQPTVGHLSTLGERAGGADLPPAALAELGSLARRALSPLLVRDGAGFGVLMERDRELRETAEPPNPLAKAAAMLGVAVNSASPTGAIVGLFKDEAQLDRIREALATFDAELLPIRPE